MIEGLKITISGKELKQLCQNRSEHHLERSRVYQGQADSMQQARVEGMSYTNGDPVKALRDRQQQHASDADEIKFIAEHLELSEQYRLTRDDLQKLGIIRNPWD